MPLAFMLAKLSSLFVKSSGLLTRWASDQLLLIIHKVSICCRKIGLTLVSWNSTVSSSILRGTPTELA